MTFDPLKTIEEAQTQKDMGTMAMRIFQGALDESNNYMLAFWASAAYWKGIVQQRPDDEEV